VRGSHANVDAAWTFRSSHDGPGKRTRRSFPSDSHRKGIEFRSRVAEGRRITPTRDRNERASAARLATVDTAERSPIDTNRAYRQKVGYGIPRRTDEEDQSHFHHLPSPRAADGREGPAVAGQHLSREAHGDAPSRRRVSFLR